MRKWQSLAHVKWVRYLKGKSAIPIHREVLNVKQGFTGKHF
jgi:hypothetical protein